MSTYPNKKEKNEGDDNVQKQLHSFYTLYSRVFMKIADVLNTLPAKNNNLNELTFLILLNDTMWATKKLQIVDDGCRLLLSDKDKYIKELEVKVENLSNGNISELEKKIEEQNIQIKNLSNEIDSLKLIFNSKDEMTYPPELDLAVKIWKEIYIQESYPKHLVSHSEKFEKVVERMNLKFARDELRKRLKTVTTPEYNKRKREKNN